MASPTDRHWETWGKTDPYFGVVSAPEFRRNALNEDNRRAFFLSGEQHVERVLDVIDKKVQHGFFPERVLEYGCGVGRIVLPFARRFAHVVAVDVAPSMLAEMETNVKGAGMSNVTAMMPAGLRSQPAASFDLVHSYIVIQHISKSQGQEVVRELLRLLKPGGIGALHVTTSHLHVSMPRRILRFVRKLPGANVSTNILTGKHWNEPRMEMNIFSLNWLADQLIEHGCANCYIQFTQHNSVRGTMLFFEKTNEAHLW